MPQQRTSHNARPESEQRFISVYYAACEKYIQMEFIAPEIAQQQQKIPIWQTNGCADFVFCASAYVESEKVRNAMKQKKKENLF